MFFKAIEIRDITKNEAKSRQNMSRFDAVISQPNNKKKQCAIIAKSIDGSCSTAWLAAGGLGSISD